MRLRFSVIVGLFVLLPSILFAVEGDLVVEDKAITSSLKFDTGAAVNEFSTDGTMGDNSDSAVPTEKAVVEYSVTGPGSSTDNAIPRFDGTGARTLQDSGVTIDDSDNMCVPGDSFTFGDGTGTQTLTLRWIPH